MNLSGDDFSENGMQAEVDRLRFVMDVSAFIRPHGCCKTFFLCLHGINTHHRVARISGIRDIKSFFPLPGPD